MRACMARSLAAFACACASMACGARAGVGEPAEPTVRDVAAAPPPSAPARERSPSLELERPEELDAFDLDALARIVQDVPALEPTPADEPLAPIVLRPPSAGDALELADLAFTRGDTLDAVAQYRMLLPDVEPDAIPYVQLQLARALAARGDRHAAETLLRRTAKGSGREAWAALVDLAKLRARDVGAREALRELGDLAGWRREGLLDHLIGEASDKDAAVLLLEKAAAPSQCGYAFEALRRWPGVPLELIPPPCWAALADHRGAILMRARSTSYIAVQRGLNLLAERWDALAAAAQDGDRAVAPWIELAEKVVDMAPLAAESGRSDDLEVIARAALGNAVELALASDPSDPTLLPRIREVPYRLAPEHREAVHRHIGALIRIYGAR